MPHGTCISLRAGGLELPTPELSTYYGTRHVVASLRLVAEECLLDQDNEVNLL